MLLEVYHFYYGDEVGHPGSILTFFPYQGLTGGRHGKGMLNTTSFSLPSASMNYWMDRLKKFGIAYKAPQKDLAASWLFTSRIRMDLDWSWCLQTMTNAKDILTDIFP